MTAVTGQNVAPPIAGSRRELPAALVRLVHGDVSESAWVRPAQIAVTLVAAVVDHTRVGRAVSPPFVPAKGVIVNDYDIPTIQVAPGPPKGEHREHRFPAMRRLAASVLLAIGLLGVGGVAIVSAVDPTPTPGSSTTTTNTQSTDSSSTKNGTTGHSSANCPNMNGTSSTSTSTSTTSSSP